MGGIEFLTSLISHEKSPALLSSKSLSLIDSNAALDQAIARSISIKKSGTNCRGFRFKECYSLSEGFSSFSRAFRKKLQDKKRLFIQA